MHYVTGAFMFSSLLRAHPHMIMHDAVTALHVKTVYRGSQIRSLLSFRFFSLRQMRTSSRTLAPLPPSLLKAEKFNFQNFLHIHLQLMWIPCQSADRKHRMNYNSERDLPPFIPCMMPRPLPCTGTTWKHLLVGTNVLCDKDQRIFFRSPAAKDKTPSERELNEMASKGKRCKVEEWEQAGQDKKQRCHWNACGVGG